MRVFLGFIIGLAISGTLTYQYGQGWAQRIHQSAALPVAALEQSGSAAVHAHPASATQKLPEGVSPVPATMPVTQSSEKKPADSTEAAWRDFMANSESLVANGEFPWGDCFRRAAAAHDVPELLLLAVARGESAFDATARSHRDAVGIMQIRWPQTAAHLGILSERELYDPCINIDAGSRYLRELLDRYGGSAHLALAAYNFGPGRVTPEHVPQLARKYSSYILEQLEAVLGQQRTPSATSQAAGRMLLLDFAQAHRARAMLEFLLESDPGLRLSIASSPRGTHAVFLSYDNDTEQQHALRAIDATGITIALAGNTRHNQEGLAHDF